MMESRKVLVNRNGSWKEISFKELNKGDNFRMFEDTGEEVVDQKGNVIFYSTSEPYKNEDGFWSINVVE